MKKINIPKFASGRKLSAGILLSGMLFASQNALAVDCRLSIVLDRSASMGAGDAPTNKCAIGLDFAIGVVQGFINGHDVRIVSPPTAANPINPTVITDYYNNQCLANDRKVEIITIAEPNGFPSIPTNFTGGFIDPAIALAQLQTLQLTDGAGTSSCFGSRTQLADTLCIAATNLRTETSDLSDIRKMEIITDGGENQSISPPSTACDASLPTEWITATGNELFFSGAPIIYDSTMLGDNFFSSSAPSASVPDNSNNEVSGTGKLSIDERNFFASLSLNTGGTVDIVEDQDDVAGTFLTPGGNGIDLCDGDLDKDFDVDNLDVLRFTKDFNNPACQINP